MPYYGFQIMVCSDKNGMSYRSTESYKSLIQQLTEISEYGFPLKKLQGLDGVSIFWNKSPNLFSFIFLF